MDFRIVERVAKQHSGPTYHQQDVDGRTFIKFDCASPDGDETRMTARTTEAQARTLLDRWPYAYRIAEDLEHAEAVRQMGTAMLEVVRENAREVAVLLRPYLLELNDEKDERDEPARRRGRPPKFIIAETATGRRDGP